VRESEHERERAELRTRTRARKRARARVSERERARERTQKGCKGGRIEGGEGGRRVSACVRVCVCINVTEVVQRTSVDSTALPPSPIFARVRICFVCVCGCACVNSMTGTDTRALSIL